MTDHLMITVQEEDEGIKMAPSNFVPTIVEQNAQYAGMLTHPHTH